MVRWHHQLDGREFEQAPGVADGQGSLECCSPRGCRVGYDWATELSEAGVFESLNKSEFVSWWVQQAKLVREEIKFGTLTHITNLGSLWEEAVNVHMFSRKCSWAQDTAGVCPRGAVSPGAPTMADGSEHLLLDSLWTDGIWRLRPVPFEAHLSTGGHFSGPAMWQEFLNTKRKGWLNCVNIKTLLCYSKTP